MTRNQRRAVRTIVYAIVALMAMAYIGFIIWRGDPITVRHIAYGLLLILFIGSLGYIAENVTQRLWIKFGPRGGEAGIGGDDAA